MNISLDHILVKPLKLSGAKDAGQFPLLNEMQSAGECSFTAPVNYTVEAVREFDHIRVYGHVKTSVSLSCSRCLTVFESPIFSTFTIVFRKKTEVKDVPYEDETELSDNDLISSTYSGDEIDLTHDIEEQVAMSIPFKPLCDEQCKGLCPECGVDLNHVSCSCADKAFNFKFSALKDFNVTR